jgi:hypothetical protein
MIDGDDVAQILWIEPCRQLSRANEVAEHDGELAALGRGNVGRLGMAGRLSRRHLRRLRPSGRSRNLA